MAMAMMRSGFQAALRRGGRKAPSKMSFSSSAQHDDAPLARDFSIVGYSQEDLVSTDKLIDLFESWMSKHGKSYRSIEEKLHRFDVFKDNLKYIDERNKKVDSYWLGLNVFADLSHEEFKKMHLGYSKKKKMHLGLKN